MSAPVNAKLEAPTYPEEENKQAVQQWKEQAERWQQLNVLVGGNPDFYPLTTKAFYVFGVIYQICECVSILLDSERRNITSIPAYGVLSSGIELLGRCVTGNLSTFKSEGDLRAGFWWLAKGSNLEPNGDYILIETTRQKYKITDLIALRNFAAHGQATMNHVVEFDNDIFTQIFKPEKHLIGIGLDKYWAEVRNNEETCNKLARANVVPIQNAPLLKTLRLFGATPYQSVYEIFSKLLVAPKTVNS